MSVELHIDATWRQLLLPPLIVATLVAGSFVLWLLWPW